MKSFIGCFVPKKTQAEKLNLATYVIFKEAVNKKVAGAIITGEFFQKFPHIAENYFDIKTIEDKPGMDRPPVNEWSAEYCWNKESDSIELITPPETITPPAVNTENVTPEFVDVPKASAGIRAALLALFSRTENITKHEYGLAIDLTNDTEASFSSHLAEAITRTPRVLALLPERQLELLTETRNCMNDSAQWTDIKKFMDKWLDAPLENRDTPAEVKPDATPEYVSLTFEQKIAVAINAPAVELDEVTAEILSDATNQRKCEYPAFIRAQKALAYIQPTLENFSDRLLGNAIRSVDFNEDKGIVACRRAILDYLGVSGEETNEDEKKQGEQAAAGNGADNNSQVPGETEQPHAEQQATTTGRTIFTLDELTAGPDVKPCGRPAMTDREIEICIAINDVISGVGNIMSPADTVELVTDIGRPIHEVVALLVCDFSSVDQNIHPAIADDEIHHLTLDSLEDWKEDAEQRSDFIHAGIVDWRKWEKEQASKECKKADSSTSVTVQNIESVNQATLSYRQQITIAALQGLCANPAHATAFDDLAGMADTLADCILNIQGCANA